MRSARCVLVVAVAIAGCVEAELVPCANGIACPSGTVCDEAHHTCVGPERAAACEGRPEAEPCLEDGACHHGICVPVECGNWLRDPREMCDDGNRVSGDGCSADCSTDERCGNGVVDPERGETCDDGDLRSHDGCDARCSTEALQFTALAAQTGPDRELAAYAFDDARGKLVVFGGLDSTGARRGETFEVDATTRSFVDRTPRISPTARNGASAAYDGGRHVVVLFGGGDPAGLTSETWTWDGERWRAMSPPTTPPRRVFAGMTYDSRRRRVLLFGGRGPAGSLADLWAWDGTTWAELHPATTPPPRDRPMFAYDPVRDRVVLFGGFSNSTQLADQWLFDGAEWTQVTPSGLPNPRFGGTLTFDDKLHGLVMIGGSGSNATQLWDGAQWSVLAPGGPMASRYYHVAYYDPAIRATVAGLGSIANTTQADLYRLDEGVWSQLAQSRGPDAFAEAAMAYDAGRGRVVLFGGVGTGGASQQTWEHDGTAWLQVAPGAPPSARFGAAMAYDERRGVTVLWGGNVLDPDVYEWNGETWMRIDAPGPAPRSRAALAYDPASQTVVMFGGEGSGMRYADTWQWNGLAWTEVTTSPAPPARSVASLAYDHARGELVLFGGLDGTPARLGDTWTWTASGGWIEKQPLAAPAPRLRHALAYDRLHRDLVLFGGSIAAGPLGDAWRWDGSTWTRVFPDDPAPPMVDAVAVYDSARGHVLLHGPAGTYRLQWRGSALDEACRAAIDRDGDGRAGCADPDCAGSCTPLCPDAAPGAVCSGPVCGDQMCSPLESCRLCDRDCGFCPARCGDGTCDTGETCSGECPS